MWALTGFKMKKIADMHGFVEILSGNNQAKNGRVAVNLELRTYTQLAKIFLSGEKGKIIHFLWHLPSNEITV